MAADDFSFTTNWSDLCLTFFFYRIIKYFKIPNTLIGFIAYPYMNNYIIQTAYETILNFQIIRK